MNNIITIPIGVKMIDEIRIQGELERCDVIAGSGQKAAASSGLAPSIRWAPARKPIGGMGELGR